MYSQELVLCTRMSWYCVLAGAGIVYSQELILCTHRSWYCVLAGAGIVYSQELVLCKVYRLRIPAEYVE